MALSNLSHSNSSTDPKHLCLSPLSYFALVIPNCGITGCHSFGIDLKDIID